MTRVAKLIMVTTHNNNKFYNMEEAGNQINVEYGRVGESSTSHVYPISKWNSIYKSKIRKGYKDVTELRLEKESSEFAEIDNETIASIVNELQALANRSIQRNYTVSSQAVTIAQVEEAQSLLNKIADLISEDVAAKTLDNLLLDLYQVIPRKMRDVRDHLSVAFEVNNRDLNKVVASEQATLDVMRGQVKTNRAQEEQGENSINILEAMGLEIAETNKKDVATIKKELGEIDHKYKRSFKIKNKKTEKEFNRWLKKAKDKDHRLFWHGSRNENWWSIIESGLVLRPTNAVITGKMFGYGLYFTDKARKSYGYTSCHGSYWARGNSNKGFMSLYDVHLGNSLSCKRRESWMGGLTEENLRKRGDYDSLTAIRGVDLYNNEFIIYNGSQCTIKYLVEVA